MEEEQPFASHGPTCSETPGEMEPTMGQPTSADPGAMEPAVGQPASAGLAAMGAAVNQQQANAPQFAYQNQPNDVNAMGLAMNQPTNNASQSVYQNQPTNNNAPQLVYQNQPTNAPQYAYQNKLILVTPMSVAAVNQPAVNNAPQFAYQNQQQNVVSSMGLAMSQPANNGPQYAYQNQPTAATPMGVAASQQPANAPQITYHNQQILVNGQFSTGLMDCFADPSLFCMTFWCRCITFGRIAEIVDQGASSCGTSGAIYAIIMVCTLLQFVYPWTYRQKMRMQYGMPEDTFGDLCIHCWCEPCSLTQEYRELQLRGYDLALGWHGNMARQNQVVFVPPSVPGGMTR